MNSWGQWGAAAAAANNAATFPPTSFPTPPVPPVPPAAAAATSAAPLPGFPMGQTPMGYPYYGATGAMPGAVPGASYPPPQWPMAAAATTAAQQQQWQQWEQWQQQYAQWQAQYGDKYQSMMAMGGIPTAAGVAPLPATGLPSTSGNPPLPGSSNDKGVAGDSSSQDKSNKRGYDAGKTDADVASPQQASKKAKKDIKETLEEMTEQEKAFDEQFKNWESQFMKWKEQNINHPDKEQYKEYEAKWESWREQLVQRREQMRKKREQKLAEERAAQLAEATNTSSAEQPRSMAASVTTSAASSAAQMFPPTMGYPPPSVMPPAGFPTSFPAAPSYPGYGFPGMMGVPPSVGGMVGATPDLVNTSAMPPDVTVTDHNSRPKMNEPPPSFQRAPPKGIPGLDLLSGGGGRSESKDSQERGKKPPQVPVTEPLMHSSDDKNPFNFPPPSQDQTGPGNFQSGPPGFQGNFQGPTNNYPSGPPNFQGGPNNFMPPNMQGGQNNFGPPGFGPPGGPPGGGGPPPFMGQGPPPNMQGPPPGPGNFGPGDNQYGNRPSFNQPPGNFPPKPNFPGSDNKNDSRQNFGPNNQKRLPGLMEGFDPNRTPPFRNKDLERKTQDKLKEWEKYYSEENEYENDPFAENNDDDKYNDSDDRYGGPPQNFKGGPPDRFKGGPFGAGPPGRGYNNMGPDMDDRGGPRGMDRFDKSNAGDRGKFGGPSGPKFDGPPGRFDGPPSRDFDGPPSRNFDGPGGGRFEGPGGRFPGDENNDPYSDYGRFGPDGERGPDRFGRESRGGGRGGRSDRGGRGNQFADFNEPEDLDFRGGPDSFGGGRGGKRGERFGRGGGDRGTRFDDDFEGPGGRPPVDFGGRPHPDFDDRRGPPGKGGPGMFSSPGMDGKSDPMSKDFPPRGPLSNDGMPKGGPPPFPHEIMHVMGAGAPPGPVAAPGGAPPGPKLVSDAPGDPTVIDYAHRPAPLKANATDLDIPVMIQPMHMFDYQHGANPGPPPFLKQITPRGRDFIEIERQLERERERSGSRGRAQSREDRFPIRGRDGRDARDRDHDRTKDRDKEDRFRDRDRRDDRDRDRRDDRDKRDRDRDRENDRRNDRDRGRNDRDRNDRDRNDRERDRERDKDRERDRERDRDRRNDDKANDSRSKDQGDRRGPRDRFDNQRPKDDRPQRDEGPPARQHPAVLVEDILDNPGRDKRPPKILVILRGPPGSGKSFVAKLIKDKEVENGGNAPRIVSLDDYFMCEVEKEETDPETKRKFTVKVMEYEFEPEMESHYRQSLIKAVRKNLADGYFPFMILDCINNKLEHFEEISIFAKQKGFQVFICEMDCDVNVCVKRNVHKRTEKEIAEMVKNWEPTPVSQTLLDVRSLLQSAAITEVEMEDAPAEEEKKDGDKADSGDKDESKEVEDVEEVIAEYLKSKWDNVESAGEKLDRLDGLVKARKGNTIKEWLELSEDDLSEYRLSRPSTSGKKRVRWADLEERQEQEKMRAIGFVVGQTDWSRMMDPSYGNSKLTQTKYI